MQAPLANQASDGRSLGAELEAEKFMRVALSEARLAMREGEIPVGAVVVHEGAVVAKAHNAPIGRNDPTAHAEILAMRQAARRLGNYRLNGCSLYVTIEPCAMCAGALALARVLELTFGAADPKAGAAGSALTVLNHPKLNHQVIIRRGVLEQDCASILREFFRQRREQAQQARAIVKQLDSF
ncbi:MAG: tRNA adenosine(34) deaminase TadA [Candidatus Acidiferrales bacterium]